MLLDKFPVFHFKISRRVFFISVCLILFVLLFLWIRKENFQSYTAIFLDSNNQTIEVTCRVMKEDKCQIVTPNIETSENYAFLGWSEVQGSDQIQYIVGDSIWISSNMKFYPVMIRLKNNQIKLTATFHGLLNEKKLVTCISENNACTIVAPEINSSDYDILGYSRSKDAFTTEFLFGDNILLTENIDYYAVKGNIKISDDEDNDKYVQYSAEFDGNGAKVSENVVTCFKDKKCIIQMPNISREGYEILGFSTKKNSKVAEIKSGEIVELKENVKYYAITKKNKITYTANFLVGNAMSIGTNQLSCQTKEVYNQEEFNNSCMIKMPSIRTYEQFTASWVEVGNLHYQYFVDQEVNISSNVNFQTQISPPEVLRIYMDSNGKDTNTGLSTTSPVLTLARAQNILAGFTNKQISVKNVKILVNPGTYYNQATRWIWNNKGYELSILSSSSTNFPVFEYQGDNKAVFFKLISDNQYRDCGNSCYSHNGETINLLIQGIEIKNYFSAVQLYYFNGITLNNVYFHNIGTKYSNANHTYSVDEYSPSAVTLEYVNQVYVKNCNFYNIENLPTSNSNYGNYIQGLYIYNASNNYILNNQFTNISCDPIRFRDGANFNTVRNNTFTKTGLTAYINDCYFSDERPSYGNIVAANQFNGGYYFNKILASKIFVTNKQNATRQLVAQLPPGLSSISDEIYSALDKRNITSEIVIQYSDSSSENYNNLKNKLYVYNNQFKYN